MDNWALIYDMIYAVVPPIEIPLSLFCVFVVLASAVVVEIRAWRRLR